MDYDVRPIEPDDEPRLERLFYRLSPETVYRRFFRPIAHPRPQVLHHLAVVDHADREALVAVDERDEIVAVARYDRLAGTTDAEVAVVVEDAWQHHGVGRAIVRQLGELAATRGITAFTAVMLGENRAALGLARTAATGTPVVRIESGEVMARIPLEPLEPIRAAPPQRDPQVVRLAMHRDGSVRWPHASDNRSQTFANGL